MNMNELPVNNKVDLHEKLMTVTLHCSFGVANNKTDKTLTNEVNTDKDTEGLKVSKELFPGETGKYLKAVRSKLSEFLAYHYKRTMSSVDDGERLIPVAFYMEYINKYNDYVPLIEDVFQEFYDNYDSCIEQVRLHPKYGKTFNPDYYKPKDELRGLLKFTMRTLPLRKASQELLNVVGEAVQSDLDTFMGEAITQAFSDVNTRVRKGLERMVEQLSDPKKKVYDSMTDSMSELVNNLIPSFNVTNDDSLNLLAEEIKEKILYANSDTLRNDIVIRQNVAAEAADILRRMGG